MWQAEGHLKWQLDGSVEADIVNRDASKIPLSSSFSSGR
jgi:hypothetical protein